MAESRSRRRGRPRNRLNLRLVTRGSVTDSSKESVRDTLCRRGRLRQTGGAVMSGVSVGGTRRLGTRGSRYTRWRGDLLDTDDRAGGYVRRVVAKRIVRVDSRRGGKCGVRGLRTNYIGPVAAIGPCKRSVRTECCDRWWSRGGNRRYVRDRRRILPAILK